MSHTTDRPHYTLTFAVLALAVGSYSLLQSLLAPALVEIQHDLHTSTTAVAWVLTAFFLSSSVATPIAGRFGDMFGKKRVLVVVLVALAVGTLIAAIATSIGVMIAGRAIQGIGSAVLPLAFGIIRDEFPQERLTTGIAMIPTTLGVGGVLGIVLSGPITDGISYHWLFWIPLVPIIAATMAAILVIPESPVRAPGRVNWLGATLLSGWLVLFLVGVSQASSWGWASARVLGLVAAAAVVAVAWIIAEQRAAEPLVDIRMMRLRGVWTTNLAALSFGFGTFGVFVLIPQFVQQPTSTGLGFGASVTEAGLFLVPSAILMLLVSPVPGRLRTRRARRCRLSSARP